jgi:hypothetical protein
MTAIAKEGCTWWVFLAFYEIEDKKEYICLCSGRAKSLNKCWTHILSGTTIPT